MVKWIRFIMKFYICWNEDVDYLDRKICKLFFEFTDEKIDFQKKKLKLWSENDDKVAGNAFELGSNQSYYMIYDRGTG